MLKELSSVSVSLVYSSLVPRP